MHTTISLEDKCAVFLHVVATKLTISYPSPAGVIPSFYLVVSILPSMFNALPPVVIVQWLARTFPSVDASDTASTILLTITSSIS